MQITKHCNSSLISLIRNCVNSNFYVTLLKDKLNITNNDFTFTDLVNLDPDVLVSFKLNSLNSNIKIGFDTEDDQDYDIKFIDTTVVPAQIRYLKIINYNDYDGIKNIVNNYNTDYYWLYISSFIDWSNIPNEFIGEFENYYKSIILMDSIDESDEYLNTLPNEGILHTYQYDNNVNNKYIFDKNSAYNDIFEFFIKFNI